MTLNKSCKSGKHCIGSACYKNYGPKSELKISRSSVFRRRLIPWISYLKSVIENRELEDFFFCAVGIL